MARKIVVMDCTDCLFLSHRTHYSGDRGWKKYECKKTGLEVKVVDLDKIAVFCPLPEDVTCQ